MILRPRFPQPREAVPWVLSTALVDINPDFAVSATDLPNQGVGGSGYDFDSGVGTTANLSLISALGHQALKSTGSAGLETTAGPDISNPFTVFMVAKFSNASPSASQYLLDSRGHPSDRLQVLSNNSNSDKFTVGNSSPFLAEDGAYDTNANLWTIRANGDATSSMTVGSQTKTGNIGSADWDFGTILCAYNGSGGAEAEFSRLLVFNRQLSDAEVSSVQSYLTSYYGL